MMFARSSKVLSMLARRRSLRSLDPRSKTETSWRRRTMRTLEERPSEPKYSSTSPSKREVRDAIEVGGGGGVDRSEIGEADPVARHREEGSNLPLLRLFQCCTLSMRC
jgi:hypothetical protein